MTNRFRVNNRRDFMIGCGFLLLLGTYLFISIISDAELRAGSALLVVSLAAAALILMASFLCVREIEITEHHLIFRPIGVTVPIADISAVNEVDYPAFTAHTGKVNGFRMTTSSRNFRWVPLNFLWAGHHMSIRTFGTDGKALHEALSRRVRAS